MTACILIFIIMLVLESVYIYFARLYGISDIPNDRSSHSRAVVRGGGIVFFIGAVIWWLWGGMAEWKAMAALGMLAAVSFADDIREMPVRVRLAVQFVAAGLILWQCPIAPANMLLLAVALILGVGLMNAFNFMDGINGLAGIYSLVTFVSLAYVNDFIVPGFVDQRLLAVSALASVVFCLFNFRNRALCFAGDVGSIVAGAIVFYALARLIFLTGNVGWLSLVAVYGIDTGLTICRRISRRENIFRAHRMHAYQLASNELGANHLWVASTVALLQCAVNAPIIASGRAGIGYLVLSAAVLAAIYLIVVKAASKKG